jgi:hypothetical protein
MEGKGEQSVIAKFMRHRRCKENSSLNLVNSERIYSFGVTVTDLHTGFWKIDIGEIDDSLRSHIMGNSGCPNDASRLGMGFCSV